jgi:hypothetical protein
VLDRVIVASAGIVGQNESHGSNHDSGMPPPNYGMVRGVIVLIVLKSVLTGFESALHTVNLIAESIRFGKKIRGVRELNRYFFP